MVTYARFPPERAVDAVGYSSGQRGQTVNLLAVPSEVRILAPPPFSTKPRRSGVFCYNTSMEKQKTRIGLLFPPRSYAIMIAVYMALDGMGTACNLTGDGAIALIVDRFRGRPACGA